MMDINVMLLNEEDQISVKNWERDYWHVISYVEGLSLILLENLSGLRVYVIEETWSHVC